MEASRKTESATPRMQAAAASSTAAGLVFHACTRAGKNAWAAAAAAGGAAAAAAGAAAAAAGAGCRPLLRHGCFCKVMAARAAGCAVISVVGCMPGVAADGTGLRGAAAGSWSPQEGADVRNAIMDVHLGCKRARRRKKQAVRAVRHGRGPCKAYELISKGTAVSGALNEHKTARRALRCLA